MWHSYKKILLQTLSKECIKLSYFTSNTYKYGLNNNEIHDLQYIFYTLHFNF